MISNSATVATVLNVPPEKDTCGNINFEDTNTEAAEQFLSPVARLQRKGSRKSNVLFTDTGISTVFRQPLTKVTCPEESCWHHVAVPPEIASTRTLAWVFRDVTFRDVGFQHTIFTPLTHISFRCEVPTPSTLFVRVNKPLVSIICVFMSGLSNAWSPESVANCWALRQKRVAWRYVHTCNNNQTHTYMCARGLAICEGESL